MSMTATDALLREWGAWNRRNTLRGIGWPPRTMLGRVIEEGPGAPCSTAPPSDDTPDHLLAVDVALVKIAKSGGAIYLEVIRRRYLLGGSIKQHCREMRCGETTFRAKLDQAVMMVNVLIDPSQNYQNIS